MASTIDYFEKMNNIIISNEECKTKPITPNGIENCKIIKEGAEYYFNLYEDTLNMSNDEYTTSLIKKKKCIVI